MNKRREIVGILLMLGLVLAACAPKAAPAPALPAPAPAVAPAPAAAPVAAAKPAWEVEWDATVQAAKKERALVHLTGYGPMVRQALGEAFKAKFDVGIEWIAGVGSEVGAKIVAERRAGIYSADTGLMGWSVPWQVLKPAGALESLDKVLFLPELTDPQEIQKVWRFGKLDWVDKEHTILPFATYVNIPLMLNTQLVKPGEIKGYRDLLNPKWKGKIVMLDPTTGTGSPFSWAQAVGTTIMGWDYLRRLAEQEPLITRNQRLAAEWVAHGKYAIGIQVEPDLQKEFRDLGAPVQPLLSEEGGFTVAGNGVSILLKDAQHASAAKLYINWLLSKEGQSIFSKAIGVPSGRQDVPTEGLNPLMTPDPKLEYYKSYGEKVIQERTEALKNVKEIFGR